MEAALDRHVLTPHTTQLPSDHSLSHMLWSESNGTGFNKIFNPYEKLF